MRFRGRAMVLAGLAWTGLAHADEVVAQPARASATGSESPPTDAKEGAPYEGGALPPGFHAERRVSWLPTIIGGTIFLGSWLGFALPTDNDPASPLRWIPIAGPLAYGATVRANDDFPRTAIMGICILGTAGQVLGLSLVAIGTILGPQVIARDAPPPVAIAPYVTPREAGIAGRF